MKNIAKKKLRTDWENWCPYRSVSAEWDPEGKDAARREYFLKRQEEKLDERTPTEEKTKGSGRHALVTISYAIGGEIDNIIQAASVKNAKRSEILRGLILKGSDYAELLEDLTEARNLTQKWMGHAKRIGIAHGHDAEDWIRCDECGDRGHI